MLCCGPLFAQQTNFPGTNIPYLGAFTVAKLPSAGIANPSLAFATDSNGGSCTSGSSTTLQLCQWNGSAWAAVGGSGSGFTAGGDLSGTSTSQTVIGVNGAVVPTSAAILASNGSKQLVAATTTGTGTTAVLSVLSLIHI